MAKNPREPGNHKKRRIIHLAFCFILFLSHFLVAQSTSSEFKTLHIKFREEYKPKNSISGRSGRTGIGRMDQVSDRYSAMTIQRVFPDAGVYEKAHQAYGLNLWYEIKFRNDVNLKKVIQEYRQLEYFEYVDECKEYTYNSTEPYELDFDPTDPFFASQWHLRNTGQTGGLQGADINISNAWKIATGSPNVIVAVLDGGIHLKHPDLIGSLWSNDDEIPNNSIDDDNNGYVDDVHGYAFGDGTSSISPHFHGTHVAGIIGGSTNNGQGISGIAGGSGINDGVRLMSCATFGSFGVGGFEAAMIYAADNGAVISQNSWGGGSRAIEVAIDYFIDRAGYDNTTANFTKNIQTGPMAGGLVIFAAGNSYTSDPLIGYPASYPKVIAVASTDHRDERSYFSNFGSWVDISAPGSDILSTVSGVNPYQILSGTSMACPQVSGVAALVISKFQRPGLSPTEVWDRLRISARPVTITNPQMIGQLGAGRLDALGALSVPDFIPPGAISDLIAKDNKLTSVELEWTATGDNGSIGQAARYEICYSTQMITSLNFGSAQLIADPPIPPKSGEKMNLKIDGLLSSTQYYFAVRSKDIFNNYSDISNIASISTLTPPIPQLITTGLSAQLYTGAIDERSILVKNIGETDLHVRLGIPNIGAAPVGFPTNARSRLFAINPNRNSIEELDNKSGSLLKSIPLPVLSSNRSEGLAFDGYNLFFGRTDKVYKLNANSGEVVRDIPLNGVSFIRGLAWSGRYLYASVYSNGDKILEIDSDNGNIVRDFPYYASELTFAGRRGTLFMLEGSDMVEVSVATGAIINRITIQGNPIGLAYSDANDLVYISIGSSILALDPDTGEITKSISYTTLTAMASDEYQPLWLQAEERVFNIPFGATANIPVSFVATELSNGDWSGSIDVIPINSNTGPLLVFLALSVSSSTDIETNRSIDFGQQYTGFPIDSVIYIENRGFSDLIVSDISVNDARVSVSFNSATLTPGQKISLNITVMDDEVGVIDALMSITSNDPDEGQLSVPIKAIVSSPPGIEVMPTSISETLLVGESKSINLTIRNTGGSTLRWNSDLFNLGFPQFNQNIATQSQNSFETDSLSVSVSSIVDNGFIIKQPSPENIHCLSQDPKTGLIYAKAITGNNFYRYDPETDNWTYLGLAPEGLIGQAVYLSGKIYHTGTQLSAYSVQNNSWTSIPFPIQTTTGVVTSDGQNIYTTLNSQLHKYNPIADEWTQLSSFPRPIGGLSHHGGMIYVHENTGSTITGDGNTNFFKYYIANNTWIWSSSIPGKASWGSTFNPAAREYIVVGSPHSQPGVRIQLAILDLSDMTWQKIAMPFQVGYYGGQVFVGKPSVGGIYITQGESGTGFVRYETPLAAEWISVAPSSGSLEPDESQAISLSFNSVGQDGGVYSGNLRIFNARPSMEEVIPFDVTVIGTPEISLNKTSASLIASIGTAYTTPLIIKNIGTDLLEIPSISISHPDYSIPNTSLSIPTGESVFVRPEFRPTSTGSSTGAFIFHNNDPDEGEVTFTLHGFGLATPAMEVTTEALSASLFSGSTTTGEISITNSGGSYSAPNIAVVFPNDWLRTINGGDSILGGETAKRHLRFDASGKTTGTYQGTVEIWHSFNFEQELLAELPATMEVISAPNLLLNKTSIEFGQQFVNYNYDNAIIITNNGVLPLSITSINTSNPAFSIGVNAPFEIIAGQSVTISIRFNPTSVGEQLGLLTFVSNDPEEGTYSINLSGSGISPPQASTNITELTVSALTDESITKAIVLNNTGGSILNWNIFSQSNPYPNGNQQPSQSAAGSFTLLNPLSVRFFAITIDPVNESIYARSQYGLSVYTPSTGKWKTEYGALYAPYTIESGSAVFLNSKMYETIHGNSATIGVYDQILRDWSSIPNQLGAEKGSIATDGNLLYIAGGGYFKSMNPKTGEWADLPLPSISMNDINGLSHSNGVIYTHEGSGSGFAKYTIATSNWETLISVPGKTVYGSTIDPIRNRYYAYGKDGGNYLYEFDITTSLWNVHNFTSFDLSDGGLVYSFEGVYFIQGKSGGGFARYEPRSGHNWLRIGPLTGGIGASETLPIALNINSANLYEGTYEGSVKMTSNDPINSTFYIPVTLHIKNRQPTIGVSTLISSTASRLSPFESPLKIENRGQEVLGWHLNENLPAWLSGSRSEGTIGGFSDEEIIVTINPTLYKDNLHIDYSLGINSNDITNPVVSTIIDIKLTNLQPQVLKGISDQILTELPFQISIIDLFSDPENDPLTYYASSSKSSIASVMVTDDILTVTPLASGDVFINVHALDKYNSFNHTTFNVVVNKPSIDEDKVITEIEETVGETNLAVSPNPVDRSFSVHYTTQVPGNASLRIISSLGEIIWKLDEYIEDYGYNEVHVDGIEFASGIYYCLLLRNGKYNQSIRLMKN